MYKTVGTTFAIMPFGGGLGWLGADTWFKQYQKDEMQFRNEQRIAALHDRLLDELRAGLMSGKIISVASYPPPTRWHPFPDIHWDKTYQRQVARRVDQMASMMYDTALHKAREYDKLMAQWTREILEWSEGTEVLLGIPVYDDEGVGYHDPATENLKYVLSGIHRGLNSFDTLPPNYTGIAIYCAWEMDDVEWNYFRREFGQK